MRINNNEMQNSCPLCYSKDIKKKGDLDYHDKVDFSTINIELTYCPELWICGQCESGFVQYIVNEDTAKMLYSTSRASESWSTVQFDCNKTRGVVESMLAIFKAKGNVLDVGCNTGELLDFAKSVGCRTSGIEYSIESRRVLADKGHNAYSSFENVTETYDVITAFDLIEHLYDVPSFLQKCREKLTERGKLVILTGDIHSLSARMAGSRWWYAQYPEHIVFPSRRYFSSYSSMKIQKCVSTYASKNYQNSFVKTIWLTLKLLLRGRRYTGLPAFGSDHFLVIMEK